ncbi:RNA-directed DNA polymerase from mobile element jockey-like [Plakobranchus ocellatus]|uniref:RNA-directed DNA polymerase from mobile element jockey-like n=1 Tax=Plakobranchus ocellatus TaxID=259542 RepID=A0AAV4C4Y6_9GAST|nr:RNA-directed DNA polymerase from mobile element jockey-like [Plakobranchus ocellatus]
MRKSIRPEISPKHFGFMPDKGTRNAIFTLPMIMERCIEMQKGLYLCFIDYSKAFAKVRHAELFRMLEKLDIDGKDLRVIRNLYWDQTASVRIEEEHSDFKPIKRALRLGNSSSSCPQSRPGTSDFHLFGPLKRHLGGMAFETEDDLISELRNWFDNLDVDSFRHLKKTYSDPTCKIPLEETIGLVWPAGPGIKLDSKPPSLQEITAVVTKLELNLLQGPMECLIYCTKDAPTFSRSYTKYYEVRGKTSISVKSG